MKKSGQSEGTLKAKGDRLRYLARRVDLDDQEGVKGFICNQASWSNAYKQGVAYAYNSYVKTNGLHWNLPHFRIEDRLPKIPTEEKINKVIVRAPRKICSRFQHSQRHWDATDRAREARARDIDLERGTITVRTAKGGEGRTVQVRRQTLALLKEYLGRHSFGLNDKPFPKRKKMTGRWVRLRNTVAAKLMDPTFRMMRARRQPSV